MPEVSFYTLHEGSPNFTLILWPIIYNCSCSSHCQGKEKEDQNCCRDEQCQVVSQDDYRSNKEKKNHDVNDILQDHLYEIVPTIEKCFFDIEAKHKKRITKSKSCDNLDFDFHNKYTNIKIALSKQFFTVFIEDFGNQMSIGTIIFTANLYRLFKNLFEI